MHTHTFVHRLLIASTGLALMLSSIFAYADSTSTALEPLRPKLEARTASFMEKAPKETIDLYEGAISDLRQSGILERALNVGDTIGGFALPNATGDTVSLASLLEDGPLVLTWYRGGWCPYCNMTLDAWREAVPQVTAAGGHLAVVSPELPDKSLTTKQKHELPFEVLSDPDNTLAHRFHIVFTLPDKVAESYAHYFSLDEYYGNDKGELPLTVTYIIDQDQVIRYAFVNADYKKRAEPAEVIAELRKLTSR